MNSWEESPSRQELNQIHTRTVEVQDERDNTTNYCQIYQDCCRVRKKTIILDGCDSPSNILSQIASDPRPHSHSKMREEIV